MKLIYREILAMKRNVGRFHRLSGQFGILSLSAGMASAFMIPLQSQAKIVEIPALHCSLPEGQIEVSSDGALIYQSNDSQESPIYLSINPDESSTDSSGTLLRFNHNAHDLNLSSSSIECALTSADPQAELPAPFAKQSGIYKQSGGQSVVKILPQGRDQTSTRADGAKTQTRKRQQQQGNRQGVQQNPPVGQGGPQRSRAQQTRTLTATTPRGQQQTASAGAELTAAQWQQAVQAQCGSAPTPPKRRCGNGEAVKKFLFSSNPDSRDCTTESEWRTFYDANNAWLACQDRLSASLNGGGQQQRGQQQRGQQQRGQQQRGQQQVGHRQQ